MQRSERASVGMTLANLFPDDDYKFQLRFERGLPADFFADTESHEELIAERKRWLREQSLRCTELLPTGEAMLTEAIEVACGWSGFRVGGVTGWEQLVALGEFWEADFMLMKGDEDGELRLHGGCICFPSHWRLGDKIGRRIEFIHDVVPGLNASIGTGIHKFLASIKPDIAWLRHNWGLSRSPELNQYPERGLPRLDADVKAEEVWVRVEHQALVALPKSGGILFGIRLANHGLTDVKKDAVAAERLVRALETMPEAMAAYKGIEKARPRIIELLQNSKIQAPSSNEIPKTKLQTPS